MATAKTSKSTIAIAIKTLIGLLGKSPKDPAVVAAMAKAGKVSFKSDFIVAKDAGFDFGLDALDEEKRNSPKVLSALFVFAEGIDGHRAYSDLPPGFTFTTREALLAALPAPAQSWKLGKGKVPVSTKDVLHDTWEVDGLSISANYRKSEVRYLNISLSEQASGRDFSTHPLHFETKPADAPKHAELVGMALLVAWSAARFGLPAKHAGSALGKQLLKREISPRTFLLGACSGRLNSLDLAPELDDFIHEYLNLADFRATHFEKAPPIALYEKAAKLRDKHAVKPERAQLAKANADDSLTQDLVDLIGKPLKDKQVKAVLTRAGMPIGKKIDEQCNPSLGVAYMGSNFEIGGKRQLGVEAVSFFAAKQKSYIRGVGANVQFAGYPGPLPHRLAFGQTREAVTKLLGKPTSTSGSCDYWSPTPNSRLSCDFARGKLVTLDIGMLE